MNKDQKEHVPNLPKILNSPFIIMIDALIIISVKVAGINSKRTKNNVDRWIKIRARSDKELTMNGEE
jgi:hypothetical protein